MMDFGQNARCPKKWGHVEDVPLEAVFNHAKRACYAGLDSITLRRELAHRIAPAIQFDSYAFSTCDPDTGLMTHTVAEGIPEALAKAFVEVIYPNDVAPISMDMPRKGIDVFSLLDESPQVAGALREHGVNEQFHISVTAGGRLWGTWCLMRGTASRSHAALTRERLFLSRLAPHLGRALQTAALIDRATSGEDDSNSESAPGVIVLDSNNRPTLRTEIATRWMDDLADEGIRMPNDLPLFFLALAAQVRVAQRNTCSELQVRARGRSGKLYVLRASLSEPGADGNSSVVLVIRPAMAQEVAKVLTRLYAFSAREREVLAAVARGEATKSIAAALGVSPHTVTEHIQRACDKIGVRGRKALLAKLFFDGYAPHNNSSHAALTTALKQSAS
jgi:DNA-binding CsgD family transcriptional regulator